MRQALNNLQATFVGSGTVNAENVFKVCDQPHPLLVKQMLEACLEGNIDTAYEGTITLFCMFSFHIPKDNCITPLFEFLNEKYVIK